MKVVGVCSLPLIPASEPGMPDTPAQIVVVCENGSVFRHSSLSKNTGWDEMPPVPGSDRANEISDPSTIPFTEIEEVISIDSVRELIAVLCPMNEDFSLADFRSRFMHYFKDANLSNHTRHRINEKAFYNLLELRKSGEIRFMGDEDPPQWGRFRRLK